jgi:hypothetical protein
MTKQKERLKCQPDKVDNTVEESLSTKKKMERRDVEWAKV